MKKRPTGVTCAAQKSAWGALLIATQITLTMHA
jgi:hypothetical protein